MSRISTVGTPLPPPAVLKTATRAAVKRKADTQTRVGVELNQSQVPGGGKRARKLESSSTPKRVSFQKILPKEDSHRQAEETRSLKEQGKTTPGGESTGIKEEKSGESKPESGQLSKEEKLPTLALQPTGHIEVNTRPRQSAVLLPRLEQALARAREKLAPQGPKPQQNQAYKGSEDNRCVEWLLEDAIRKLKAGTFQLAPPEQSL